MSGHELIPRELSLRSGELVEIRSEQEILSTLDERGGIDGLPFMPEMRQFCGKRVEVYRRADKTCDTVYSYTSRRLTNTVHLKDLRCDGGHHGGCEAGCLLFWKEAWLKRVGTENGAVRPPGRVTSADLEALTTRPGLASSVAFVCQATELPVASTPLHWWDPRQYVRELRWGNVRFGTFIRALAIAWFNAVQRRLGGRQYPYVAGTLDTATPSRRLDLQPGERVRVRSRDEILATLNKKQRNRGLWFDMEMVPYCGGEYRVLRRVTHIVEERTGKLINLPGDCVILEGVVCQGCLSRNRLFCPRSIYPYWREIWLERVES